VLSEGKNALSMLSLLNIKLLLLIDPYEPFVQRGELLKFPLETEHIAHELLEKFEHNGQVKFIKKSSKDAAKDLSGVFDFVYIDGCHDYDIVHQDIQLYYPLVADNGVIGGHDYTNYGDVRVAVNRFAKSNNLNVNSLHPDWWIIKPTT
jgi:hypothetical protein